MANDLDRTPDEKWWNQFLETRQPSPKTMLDLGCGHGRHVCWFANHGFQSTGIEIKPERIEEARRRAGSNPNATFVKADLADLEKLYLAAHFFGVIFDRNSSQFMSPDQQEQFFANVANLLAPDGVFTYSILEATGSEAPPFIKKLEVGPADTLPIIEQHFNVIQKNVRPSSNLADTVATEVVARI